MASSIYSYGAPLIPGSFITFLLLLFMMALVHTGIQAPIEPKKIPLNQIYHVKDPPTTFDKPVKPDEPSEVADTPELVKNPGNIDPPVGPHAPRPVEKVPPPTITLGKVDTGYIPVYVPQPRFPIKALRHGINGYAVVDVTIKTGGSVKNPSILEEYPLGYGFGKAALKAAEKLKYQPKVVDGNAVEVPGVQYKYSFAVEE